MVRGLKVLALPVAAAVALLGTGAARAGSVAFQDNFTDQQPVGPWAVGPQYVGTDGKWTLVFDGYGHVGEETDTAGPRASLALEPAPPVNALDAKPLDTIAPEGVLTSEHAALVTSVGSFGDSTLSVSVRTVAQLRQTATQNPWEVGWVLWHYTDPGHFYYLILKPNGWELGKEDPSALYGQRFLATGDSPTFPVGGRWNAVNVVQKTTPTGAEEMIVSVNGQQLADYTDDSNPYMSGKVALYDEDSYAHFAAVQVSGP